MLVVMVMALALGLLAGTAMAQTGTLTGTVTDADTGLTIDHALVVARGEGGCPGGGDGPGGGGHGGGGGHQPPAYAYTDASGAYAFPELPAGTYRVTCGKPGYVRVEVEVVIEDGQTITQDFALEPMAYGSVGGTVTDAVSFLPIEGAHVMLYVHRDLEMKGGGGPGGGGGGMWLHAVTDVDGNYLIPNVPVGTYDARAMMFGYLPSDPLPVIVAEGVQSDADFALAPLTFGSLEGVVSDAGTGEPIEGAFVVACRFGFDGPAPGEAMTTGAAIEKGGGGGGWNVVMTDENGFYSFDQLPAGTWTVRAFMWGYLAGVVEVTIVENQTTVQNFALTPR
jgi:hypothetical protein